MWYEEHLKRSMDRLSLDSWAASLTARAVHAGGSSLVIDCPCCLSLVTRELAAAIPHGRYDREEGEVDGGEGI